MKSFRYVLEAILAFLSYGIISLLPVRLASFLLGKFACLIGPNLKAHQTARENLTKAFPHMNETECKDILHRMWENLGRTIGEVAYISRCSYGDYQRFVEVEGVEYLTKFLKQGQAAIFFSAHIANWELTAKTAAMYGTPLALVYRPSNNMWIEKLVMHVRKHYQATAIAKGFAGAREVIKCLKEGQPIGMLLDQKMNDGIAVPFFGRNAMTAPAVANLARKFKCPVIPAQIIRKQGVKFKVVIYPPLYPQNSGDAAADTLAFMTQINQMMEKWIRENPEQWFWVHNRWPKNSPK